MQNPILVWQSLEKIEKNIITELTGKELWGDIDVTLDDYQNLKARIKMILGNGNINIRKVCARYPCSITTFMIFLVRYEFNSNFWGLIGEELNINVSGLVETVMGKCARLSFKKYGFDFSDVKGEVRVNLEPILYEAGIPPESSFDDLFYILKYDTYSVFDPQLIIEDLIEMRSYQIRKPMLRFLKRFKEERAIEFVLEIHDAMLTVDQHMPGNSVYIGNYVEWKTKETSKEYVNIRKKQQFQTKPYLTFENGKRGLCIVLPRTIIKYEWVDEVEWVIVPDDLKPVHKCMNVFGDEGRRFVDIISVPVNPAKNYHVSMHDCDGLESDNIVDWTVNGIGDDNILFFNANGRIISLNYLNYPYGIMIMPKSFQIIKYQNTSVTYQVYPTNREEYSIVAVEPTGRDAFIQYSNNYGINTLQTRPQISMELEGNHIFSLRETSIFTELPQLSVCVDDDILTNGYELRLGSEIINISQKFSNGKVIIQLEEFKDRIYSKYGTYSVRLYQYDHFVKQVEFSYVPDIKTNYSPIMMWPSKYKYHQRKVFTFERKEDWSLEFHNCKVNNDEYSYHVECPKNVGSIMCVLKSIEDDDGFTCRFELPVNPFEIDIIDSQGLIQDETTSKLVKLGLDDINSNPYWVRLECFGDYKNCNYKIKLKSVNGIEQEENLSLTQNGCVNYNLMVFNDTLNTCPLPAILELSCNEEDKNYPIAIVSDNLELQSRPFYTVTRNGNGYVVLKKEDENRDLIIKRFGRENKEWELLYTDSRILNGSNGIKVRGYLCSEKLTPGLYSVEGNKQKLDFIFEDDTNVEISNGNNTMYISNLHAAERIDTFSVWLDLLIRDIVKSGINKSLKECLSYRKLDKLKYLKSNDLKDNDYEKCISLAYFLKSKCIDIKKEEIRKCMRCISCVVLNSERRLELIRILSDMNSSQEIFDICLNEYNLLLFERGSYDSKKLAEKIENYSPVLALMLLMGFNDSIMNTIRREKFRDLIGQEAIKDMLSVPSSVTPDTRLIEQKKFLREIKPCRVKINLSNEISGDMDPIQEMLEIDHRDIKFNILKKPDYGIYFDHIRYVDQYVNWYTMSHNKHGEMFPEKRSLMKACVQAECKNIIQAIEDLEKLKKFGLVVKSYHKTLKARFRGNPFANMNANNYQRYFYLQGLAAFLTVLPTEYKTMREIGERFMVNTNVIAPKISRRDLVMASTYIYLVRKEKQLCQ